MIAMLLCALISSVMASSIPAPTPASAPNSTLTFSGSAHQATPTDSPGSPNVAEYQQLAAAASSSNGPTNHNINVEVSQPVMCEYMNITFDPSRGTPPYTVMISIEDYWPVTVDLPANYDDASKDLWLYQWSVPTFNGATTNPSLIVSVTDSTGLMSNSSSFVQTSSPNAGASCPVFQYTSSFYFYTERAASMCQDYEIFWNGSWAPPITAIFLPESQPPIYVPAPSSVSNNMTWQVAIEGGTRFVTTLGDSRANSGSGGVSKLNIVALNEYFSNACIAQSNYQHRLFAPTITASPASVFPDATSTIASLTTNKGMVATVTVIETIKNGRAVHGNGGALSSVTFLIIMVVVFVTVGLVGVAVGWYCFRRHQKRKFNIKAWDLPNNDPSVPFSADPNMPIAPGVFGRGVNRQASTATRGAAERASLSGVSNYDPVSLTSRPLTHANSIRGSLRSWTSGAFDHLQIATGHRSGHQPSSPTADDYALMNTGSGAISAISPSETHGFAFNHARNMTVGTMSNGSRDGWSPIDSVARNFGFYSDDPQSPQNRNGGQGGGSRPTSSDGASVKSNRVGPGPTYRPDAASQAAYQDLLASNTSPTSGVDRSFPFSAAHGQNGVSTASRGQGWTEVSDEARGGTYNGTDNSTRIVRHADAGLLLDDNDNGDELISLGTGRLMELPPQYDTIHPGTGTQQRPLYAQSQQNDTSSSQQQPRSQRSHAQNMASVDISDARNRPIEVHAADLVDENDDESAFWAH